MPLEIKCCFRMINMIVSLSNMVRKLLNRLVGYSVITQISGERTRDRAILIYSLKNNRTTKMIMAQMPGKNEVLRRFFEYY